MFIMQIYSKFSYFDKNNIYNSQNAHMFQPCQDNTYVQTTVAGLMFKRNKQNYIISALDRINCKYLLKVLK